MEAPDGRIGVVYWTRVCTAGTPSKIHFLAGVAKDTLGVEESDITVIHEEYLGRHVVLTLTESPVG